jgi:uncharacterized membrane protein YgdD (TMEM256/DUF423 family)
MAPENKWFDVATTIAKYFVHCNIFFSGQTLIMNARLFVVCGALSAAISVTLGAAGAHGLAHLPELSQSWFRTALQYQQFHALGLLAVGLLALRHASIGFTLAGWLMIAGTLLFSGNLYLRSLADFHALHMVTPWGGGALILAWLALAAGALTSSFRRA